MENSLIELKNAIEDFVRKQAQALGISDNRYSVSIKVKIKMTALPPPLIIGVEIQSPAMPSFDDNVPRPSDDNVPRLNTALKTLEVPVNTVAKIVGVKRQTVHDWISGVTIPSDQVVELFEKRARDKLETLARLGLT